MRQAHFFTLFQIPAFVLRELSVIKCKLVPHDSGKQAHSPHLWMQPNLAGPSFGVVGLFICSWVIWGRLAWVGCQDHIERSRCGNVSKRDSPPKSSSSPLVSLFAKTGRLKHRPNTPKPQTPPPKKKKALPPISRHRSVSSVRHFRRPHRRPSRAVGFPSRKRRRAAADLGRGRHRGHRRREARSAQLPRRAGAFAVALARGVDGGGGRAFGRFGARRNGLQKRVFWQRRCVVSADSPEKLGFFASCLKLRHFWRLQKGEWRKP